MFQAKRDGRDRLVIRDVNDAVVSVSVTSRSLIGDPLQRDELRFEESRPSD
jgi:hypothetical protein